MLVSACTAHDGRLLVVVSTDMPVPSQLAHIEVRTIRSAGGGMETRGFPVDDAALDARRHMPLSFAVVPNGHPRDGVDIIVEGYGPGDPICTGLDEPAGCRPLVSRTVRTGFSPGTTRVVDIFLASACRAVSCPGQNCVSGRCEPIAFTPPGDFPILEVPGREFDTRAPDAGMDAPLVDTSGLDVPGLDVPDAADLDAPIVPMDVPMDAPDAPGFVPGEIAVIYPPFAGVGAFGTSVALSPDGTTGLVGAPLSGPGRVHVLAGDTLASLDPLLPPDGIDYFGTTVALGGRGATCRALVGTQGEAYPHDCATWTRGAALTRSSPGIDSFGNAIAISTDASRAIVGAVLAGPMGSGAAWRFAFSGSWTELGTITLVDGLNGEALGRSVALDGMGSRALVGVPFRDVGGNVDQGIVLSVDAAGMVFAPLVSGLANDHFGSSVALSNDGTIALVARQGEAVAFRIAGDVWTPLGAPLHEDGMLVAPSVALIDEDDALLASPDLTGGVVRWFHWTGSAWEIVTRFTSTSVTSDSFGASIAVSRDGRRALVGAPADSMMGGGAGAVYLYALAP